jgi:hypothetical protein
MRLRILDLARDDLIDGFHFYERKEAGLGDYFLACLYSDIESLRVFGGIHGKAHRHFHRGLSKGFPFAIYYTLEDGIVLVRAVVDCRKDPLGSAITSEVPNRVTVGGSAQPGRSSAFCKASMKRATTLFVTTVLMALTAFARFLQVHDMKTLVAEFSPNQTLETT